MKKLHLQTSIIADIECSNVLFLFCPKNKCPILVKKIVCLLLRSQCKNIVGSVAKSLLPFKALVPLVVKKSYKSLENNLSLGGAKKYK